MEGPRSRSGFGGPRPAGDTGTLGEGVGLPKQRVLRLVSNVPKGGAFGSDMKLTSLGFVCLGLGD